MAYTATLIKNNVIGNQRVQLYNVTADAASGAVAAALGVVDAAFISPISMATAAPHVKINLNAAGSAANGSVQVSSAASGDNFFMMIYGH